MARALVLLALASCLAILLAGPAGAARALHTVCSPACPQGMSVVPYYGYEDTCEYSCLSPVKLNCVGRQTPPALYQQLVQPYLCAGTSGVSCPTVACAYSASYAISGPSGCAFTKSVISSTSISSSAYSYAEAFASALGSYCDHPADASVEAYAVAVAEAYATAVAATVAQYSVFVCNCGCGTLSANYAVVAADLQAVASAVAISYAEAFAGVESCYGPLITGAIALGDALAYDTQLAIDTVYKSFVYAKPGSGLKCTQLACDTQIKVAVARAAACTFAQAFAAAANSYAISNGNNEAYACSSSIAIAQFDLQCPYTVGC